jgi:hypothetical protein
MAHDSPAACRQVTVLDEATNVESRREGLISRALGFLVVIAAAVEIDGGTILLAYGLFDAAGRFWRS